jgi:hypothetical protein
MAVNENGRLLDDGGNIVVDHVWGNLPPQPNDVRLENGGTLLNPNLDNHAAYLAGWGGFPLYTPNSPGEGLGNLVVPSVLGLTVAAARRSLIDAGYLTADITTASAYTPAVSNVALTSNVATLTTAAAHGFAVGDSVVIAGLSNVVFNGTFTLITGTTGSTLVFAKTNDDVASASDAGTAKVVAKAGKIVTQSVAPGADNVIEGDTITVTPYYAS